MKWRGMTPWSVLWLLLAALYFLLPVYGSAAFSLETGPGKYGFDAYASILQDPAFKHSFLLSLRLAIETVVISVVLMVPTVYWVDLKLPGLRPVIGLMAVLPFVVPPIALVAGVLRLFHSLTWLVSRPEFLVLPYVILTLPFTYRCIDTGLSAVDLRTLTEAARGLGARRLTIVLHIIVPNIRVSVLSAALLTVILVMGEYTISSLMLFNTFAVYVEYIGETRAHPAAALAMIVFALTWAAMLGMLFLGRGIGRRSAQIGGTH